MIRRLKTDVLKDLPPKRRQIIELPTGGLSAGLRRQIQEATREWDRIEREFAADVRAMEDRLIVAWEDMAELRHEVGLAKAKMSIDLIHDMVAGAGKLVVFAWHRDVIEMLENTLVDYRPSVLVGGMSPKAKQVAIDSFQNDPATKIFIGQLQASGTAITLTAASNELFIEEDWTPGAIDQAEDRCHRIGQLNPVLPRHLALEGSLDARMFKIQERKRSIITRALDGVPN